MSLAQRTTDLATALGQWGKGITTRVSALEATPGLPAWAGVRSKPWVPERSVYNWKASNTWKLRTGLARAANGEANTQHVIIGDSWSAGSAERKHAEMWPVTLRRALVALGIPDAGTGWVPLAHSPLLAEQRVTGSSGTWTIAGAGGYFQTSTAGGWFEFQFDIGVSTIGLTYSGLNGAFTISVDGGTPVSPTRSGANAWNMHTITGLDPSVRHKVRVTNTTTTTGYYQGIIGLTSAAAGLAIHNPAIFGSTANEWATSTDIGSPVGGRWDMVNRIGSGNVDVAHIAVGINDAINSGTPWATTLNNLTTIRNKALLSGADILLYIPGLVATTATNYSLWRDSYLPGMYALADSWDVPLFDFAAQMGTWEQLSGRGMLYDTSHTKISGSKMVAQTIAAQIIASGGVPFTSVPRGVPTTEVFVTSDWATDPHNPANGGVLPAGVPVIET